MNAQTFAVGVLSKTGRRVGISWKQIMREPLRSVRFLQFWLFALLLLFLLPTPGSSQGVVTSPHPLLSDRLESLEERSPTLKASLDSVRALPGAYLALHANDIPRTREVARTVSFSEGVLVYVDFDKAELTEEELDVVIVHEIFGHAVPVLLHNEVCADPVGAQRWGESCVAQREAVVLRELGFQEREQYAIGRLR